MATYTVKAGDTLSGIAQRLGLPSYTALSGYNRANPNLINPGLVLTYGGGNPAPAAPAAAPARSDGGNEELTAAVNASNKAFQDLIASQNSQQEGLFGAYTDTSNNQEKLPAIYDRLNQELGINDLSKVVQGYKDQILTVQQLLGNLTGDVTTRNKGTFTNDAQANRQIAAEGAPLRDSLSNLGYAMAPAAQALSGAQGTAGTLLNLTVQQQSKDLHPLELRIASLGDKFSREITGFTSQKQDTLNALMDKIQRNRQLSDMEWQNAQDLAKQETDFQHQKQLYQIQANASVAAAKAANPGLSTPKVAAAPTLQHTATDWASLVQGNQPGISFQAPSSSMKIQGSSIPLQGGGFSLQGGGIRLQ